MKYDVFDLIRNPVITEKSTKMKEAQNKVCLEVDIRANKRQIKEAVERVFNVTVVRVNTMRLKGKMKRFGRYTGKRPDRKRAIITLREGDRIDYFEGA